MAMNFDWINNIDINSLIDWIQDIALIILKIPMNFLRNNPHFRTGIKIVFIIFTILIIYLLWKNRNEWLYVKH